MNRSVRDVRASLLGLLVFLFVVPASAEAQRAALTGYGGWKFGGTMNVQQGELNSAASEHFGAELALRVRQDASAILLVDYQPSRLRLRRPGTGGANAYQFDMDIWYFQAGGQVEIINRGRVVPYATGTLGVAWFNPTDESRQRDSETMFAGMFGGGMRVPLGPSGKAALSLEGRMYLTVPWGGASVYCSGGSGCYGGFGGTIGPVQGAVLAGLRLALGPR